MVAQQETQGLCRIGIVDDDALTLAALRHILETQLCGEGIVVAWAVRDGGEAVERCVNPATRPDAVLVDMGMDQVDGPTTCRRIRTFSDNIFLFAITSHSLNCYRSSAQRSGAQALLDKADIHELKRFLTAFASGVSCVQEGFLSPGKAHASLSSGATASGLTAKETEVMDLTIQGLTAREVAEKMGLSESTVKTHIRHVINKLGARNKLHAIHLWYERQDK